MNIVHNCLDKYIGTAGRAPAGAGLGGRGGRDADAHLRRAVPRGQPGANALRSLGLGKGDAIGLFMPMTPEIVVALLAIAKIGGIILPLFSGYGAGAIVARLARRRRQGALHRRRLLPARQGRAT